MNLKLVVFDWDGTLMDSEARIVACMREAIDVLKMDVRSDQQIRNIIGLGLSEAVRDLFPDAAEPEVEQLVQGYRHQFLVANQTPSELFEGAREAVEAVSDMGYLLAVATGKGRRGLDQVLYSTGLGKLFHATRCADETRSKPHPDMLIQIMDELGAEARETLMVGDTEYDLQMATNAGAHSLAMSYGVHESERLLRHKPLACLHDIRDLPKWIADTVD